MSILSCLDHPPPPAEELLIGDGLFNIIGAMVFGSIALVALFAPLIRRAYRNHVVRLMGLDQVQPRPHAWWQRNAAHSSAAAPASRSLLPPRQLRENASSWEARMTRATAAGWLTFVIMAWPLTALITPDPSLLDQLDSVAGAGLLALIPMFANLPQRWKRKVLMVSIVTGLVVVTGLEIAINLAENQQPGGAEEEASLLEDIAAALLVLGLLYTIFHRRLRGLVFPVSVVISVFVLVVVIPLALVEQHLGSCLSGVQTSVADTGAEQIRSSGLAMIFALVGLLGLWLGFHAVGALARFVDRGYLSDLSMISLIGLALVSVFLVYGAVEDTADSYSLWTAWTPFLWLLLPVIVYRIVLGRRPDAGPGRDLLVLRVFSRDKKKQAFLDELQSRWRYMGAVNLAGGPDMVDLNVDPYECAMFLSSQLHELFLPQALDARHLAARFSNMPDHEGRYRINEMFNFNTAWRENVEQLILLSKTILLDVRGLTAEREGTSFEISLLARHGLLDRVIAVGDDETDWQHIGRQIEQDGQSVQQLNRFEESKDFDGLIARLLDIGVTA